MKRIPNVNFTVKNDLCVGCGICQGACPTKAIDVIAKDNIFIPSINAELCNNSKGCHRCLDCCPGLGANLDEISSVQFSDVNIKQDSLVGRYLNCYVGKSLDEYIRFHSSSGGLVSSLLIYFLEKGIIDGAYVTAFDNTNPLMVRSFVARNREDVLSAKGSKYAPVTLNRVAEDIKNDVGTRFIIVGLPCHIEGLRKFETKDPAFKRKIFGYFGLYCSGGRTFGLTEYVLKQRNIQRRNLSDFSYRDEGCLGYLVAKRKNEPDYKEHFQSYYHPLRSIFTPKRCLMCIDHFAELADVSFGDIHIKPYSDDKVGISSMVVRNAKFADMINDAIKDGVISATVIDVDILKSSQKMAYVKKSRNANIIKYYRLLGRQVPKYDNLKTQGGIFKAALFATFASYQRFIGSHKRLWWLINYLKKKPHFH